MYKSSLVRQLLFSIRRVYATPRPLPTARPVPGYTLQNGAPASVPGTQSPEHLRVTTSGLVSKTGLMSEIITQSVHPLKVSCDSIHHTTPPLADACNAY
jgi:hypothetical protein